MGNSLLYKQPISLLGHLTSVMTCFSVSWIHGYMLFPLESHWKGLKTVATYLVNLSHLWMKCSHLSVTTYTTCAQKPCPSAHIHLNGLKVGQCPPSNIVCLEWYPEATACRASFQLLITLLILVPDPLSLHGWLLWVLHVYTQMSPVQSVFSQLKITPPHQSILSPCFISYIFLFMHLLSCFLSVSSCSCRLGKQEPYASSSLLYLQCLQQ